LFKGKPPRSGDNPVQNFFNADRGSQEMPSPEKGVPFSFNEKGRGGGLKGGGC